MTLLLCPNEKGGESLLSIDTGLESDLYRVLILLHIIVAILGFGGVLWNGVYAFHSMKRPGPQGRAISEANFSVSALAEYAIYAVPVTGVLATVGICWSLVVRGSVDLAQPCSLRDLPRRIPLGAHPRAPQDQPAPGGDGEWAARRRRSPASGGPGPGSRQASRGGGGGARPDARGDLGADGLEADLTLAGSPWLPASGEVLDT